MPRPLIQRRLRLPEVEHQGFLHQQVVSRLYDLEGRTEVVEVGQAKAYEVGTLRLQHLTDVEVGADAELFGTNTGPIRVSSHHRAEVRVLPLGEDAGVLPSPGAGPDQ